MERKMEKLNKYQIQEIADLMFDAAGQLGEYLDDDYRFDLTMSKLQNCSDVTVIEIAKIIISLRDSADTILSANKMG